MKTVIAKIFLFTIILAAIGSCKKDVYPEQIQFLVIDSFSRQPISGATINLYKVWQHPIKIGDNSKKGDWFPEYGRKHMTETQVGFTDEYGRVTFKQEHKKYLYILPSAQAEGYQLSNIDTLAKISKKKVDNAVYTIAMRPMIKATFVLKSKMPGLDKDSVVFSSSGKEIIAHGKNIDERLEVLVSNSIEPYATIWYGGIIYRNGKKVTLCHYVVAYPNDTNVFNINIDI